MTGGIIVTHAAFSQGLKESLEMILGKQEHLETVILKEGDGLFELKEKIRLAMNRIGLKDNIIFVDLFGATTFNAASLLCTEMGCPVVTGVNMPVLFEFLSVREEVCATEMEDLLQEAYNSSFHFIRQQDLLNTENK